VYNLCIVTVIIIWNMETLIMKTIIINKTINTSIITTILMTTIIMKTGPTYGRYAYDTSHWENVLTQIHHNSTDEQVKVQSLQEESLRVVVQRISST
jgi:hypothetical protein